MGLPTLLILRKLHFTMDILNKLFIFNQLPFQPILRKRSFRALATRSVCVKPRNLGFAVAIHFVVIPYINVLKCI